MLRNLLNLRLFLSLLVLVSTIGAVQNTPDAAKKAWADVEWAMGRSGQMQAGEVIKFAMPRKDLKVTVNGVAIKPGLALGSWAAFMRHGNEVMVMGDLVLTEDEIAPVMTKL